MQVSLEDKYAILKSTFPKTHALSHSIIVCRTSLNMTAKDLGKAIGLSQSTINLIELGKRRVTQNTLESICSYLDIGLKEYMLRYMFPEDDSDCQNVEHSQK